MSVAAQEALIPFPFSHDAPGYRPGAGIGAVLTTIQSAGPILLRRGATTRRLLGPSSYRDGMGYRPLASSNDKGISSWSTSMSVNACFPEIRFASTIRPERRPVLDSLTPIENPLLRGSRPGSSPGPYS